MKQDFRYFGNVFRFVFVTVALFCLSSAVLAADDTVVGTATAAAKSSTWIEIDVPFTGDDDGDGYTVYEIGPSATGPFSTYNPPYYAYYSPLSGTKEWRKSVFYTVEDSINFLRVTFVDPDGVTGANPQIIGPVTTPATDSNSVTVESATATALDTEIFVNVPILNDANKNSDGTIEVATSSSGPWTKKAGPLPFHPKRARIRSLTPNTDYWVRVTITDPDDVVGTNPQILGPITYTGLRNLALGQAITADPGWGCCPNPSHLVDGRIQNDSWTYGFSWTGGTGGWAGGAPGVKQATIDFGVPTEFSRAAMWYHYQNSVPLVWKFQYSYDGATWTDAYSNTEARCRTATEAMLGAWGYPGCGHDATFPSVTARYFRYSFDDTTLFAGIHGWAVELEVFNSPCISVSVPTGLQALRNTTLTVPVDVTDTTGSGATAFDFTLNYDPAVLTPSATPFDTAGTLSDGYVISVNSSTAGSLVVSGFGTTDLSGAGTLLNLKFDVIGSAPSTSNLDLSGFTFNEGTPCATTANGQAQVINGTIAGTVTYGASATTLAVPNVSMTAAGAPNINGATDSSGVYSLSGFGNGAYTVTAAKTGDVNGAVTAFDAAKVAQHVVGTSILTANRQIAADVSNNGSISSFDASMIARYAVNLPNTGTTGTWKFVPANRSYANVEADWPDQDYTAILMGEVSGNWTPPATFGGKEESAADTRSLVTIGVSLSNQYAQSNSNVMVPINVQDLTGLNVLSYEFDLAYDPSVLQMQASPVDVSGTLSNGMSVTVNTATPGLLRVAAFGTNPLSGAGVLLKLNFTAVGAPGAVSPLMWQRFMFNEDDPQCVTTNGQVTIMTPTAATVSVGGRVSTASGYGVPNARVTMMRTTGEARSARTNPFGYFYFADVPTGEVYVFSVSHKEHSFSPQALNVTEETFRLNFIADNFR